MLGIATVIHEDFPNVSRTLAGEQGKLGDSLLPILCGYVATLVTAVEKTAEANGVRAPKELTDQLDAEAKRYIASLGGSAFEPEFAAPIAEIYETFRTELQQSAYPATDIDNLAGTLVFEAMAILAAAAGRWDDLEEIGEDLYQQMEEAVQKLRIETVLKPLTSPSARESREVPTSPQVIRQCTACGRRLAVPGGKGRIRITCPHCGRKEELTT
jgi:DNA-directed RNA polymerase subunit RPC12/RpoP